MVCHQPIVIISLQCCCGLVDYIVDIPEKGFKNSVVYCGELPFGTRAAAAAAQDRERSTQPNYINIFIIILCPRSFYCASFRRSLQLLKADYYIDGSDFMNYSLAGVRICGTCRGGVQWMMK